MGKSLGIPKKVVGMKSQGRLAFRSTYCLVVVDFEHFEYFVHFVNFEHFGHLDFHSQGAAPGGKTPGEGSCLACCLTLFT